MMWLAIVLFVFSLALIAGLFIVKYWELSHDRILYADTRKRADAAALQLKDRIAHTREYAALVPSIAMRVGSIVVHESALAFASLARLLERGAYKIADFVSHRRYFSPRETRSEFLQKMSEYKNGARGGVDV